MKLKILLSIIFVSQIAFAQNTNTIDSSNANHNFDSELANKLEGDDYGMKRYFLVILKSGSNAPDDKELRNSSFRGHLDNINKLAAEGKIVVAGPLLKNENNYRGIFILDKLDHLEEAEQLLQTDPAIKNGFLDFEIYTWYGSAALPEYLPASEKIWKSKP